MTMDKTGKEGDGGKTQAEQETLQPGSTQTSTAEQLTSKIEEGKQYSGVEVKDILSADGRVQKDRADKAEGEVRRLTGEVNGFTTQVNTLTTQMAEITKAQNEAELAKYSEDPPRQTEIRVKQAQAIERIRLEAYDNSIKAREANFTNRETEVGKRETSVNIKLVAMEAGVDEVELADLVPDGNPARLKKAADILKKRGPTDDQLRRGKVPGLGQRPASAISAGSGGASGLTADEKIQRGLDQKRK